MSQYKRMVDASYSRVVAELAEMKHDLAEAREKLAEREATVDILVQRVHERDAELGELKQSGKTERRFTNDYIKALHKAEHERDEAKQRWERTIDELGRVIKILAGTNDDVAAVNACQPYASDLARRVVAERNELRALLSDADERAHLAHGVAELAMKHRDAAERERDDLRALLRECRDFICAQGDYDAAPSVVQAQPTYGDMLARIDACLENQA